MIEINELTKRYEDGVLALDHVTYKVEQGEIFCLLGANGAGKTTTINILLDFIPPTSGHAFINGHGELDIDGESRVIDGYGDQIDVVDMGADEYCRVHNTTQDNWYYYIQDAIDNASDGDEVVINEGTEAKSESTLAISGFSTKSANFI